MCIYVHVASTESSAFIDAILATRPRINGIELRINVQKYYGRWVKFTLGHDIVTIGGWWLTKRKRGSLSIQVSYPPRWRATEIWYRRKVLYSYSHFSPVRYLTLPSLTSTPKFNYRYIGWILLLVHRGYMKAVVS